MRTGLSDNLEVSDEDRRLFSSLKSRLVERFRPLDNKDEIELLRSGSYFFTAKATHIATQSPVLLTFSRIDDSSSFRQVAVVRRMLRAVGDERLGNVVDLVWEGKRWACLASTFHADLEPLDKKLAKPDSKATYETLIGWMRDAASQLKKIHDAGYAHGDISLNNIAIDKHNQVHIIDFEFAVEKDRIAIDRKRIGFTPRFTHPDKIKTLRKEAKLDVSYFQAWDRYSLGQVYLAALGYATPDRFPGFSPKLQRALRLIGCLLLDGKNSPGEFALGLPKIFFATNSFRSLEQVIAAFDRLTGRRPLSSVIPELTPAKHSVVEVGIDEPVALTDRVRLIIDTPHMQSLGAFRQLGLINYIWPTAVHTRKEHVLGTFGLVCGSIRGLSADPESPIFDVFIGKYEAKIVMLAALLHDVGHFPLAHDLEEACASVFRHENRSIEMILSDELGAIIESPDFHQGWDVSRLDVASVISGYPLDGAHLSPHICGFLHSIISGPIDADKLDYLVRDSERLNVNAGRGLDRFRIMSSYTVVVVNSDHGVDLLLGVRAKGRRPAELVGRIRSHMFGVVYWHHTYRAIKAMMHWIVWSRLSDQDDESPDILSRSLFKAIDNTIARTFGNFGSMEIQDSRSGEISNTNGEQLILTEFSEMGLIEWLRARGGTDVDEMADLLTHHEWYRAVLTVPAPRNGTNDPRDVSDKVAENLWSLAIKLFAITGDKYWQARYYLAKQLQLRVVDWLYNRSEGESRTHVANFSGRKHDLVSDAELLQLFLFDWLDTGKGQKPLYWTTGDARQTLTVDASAPIPYARSLDEVLLSESFQDTNGALRIFVHPTYADFIDGAMENDTLADMLADSLNKTLEQFEALGSSDSAHTL